jgi:hypothetical protein
MLLHDFSPLSDYWLNVLFDPSVCVLSLGHLLAIISLTGDYQHAVHPWSDTQLRDESANSPAYAIIAKWTGTEEGEERCNYRGNYRGNI